MEKAVSLSGGFFRTGVLNANSIKEAKSGKSIYFTIAVRDNIFRKITYVLLNVNASFSDEGVREFYENVKSGKIKNKASITVAGSLCYNAKHDSDSSFLQYNLVLFASGLHIGNTVSIPPITFIHNLDDRSKLNKDTNTSKYFRKGNRRYGKEESKELHDRTAKWVEANKEGLRESDQKLIDAGCGTKLQYEQMKEYYEGKQEEDRFFNANTILDIERVRSKK